MLIVPALVMVTLVSGVPEPTAPPKVTVALALAVLMLKSSVPFMLDKKLMLSAPLAPIVSTVMLPVATLIGLLKLMVEGPVPVVFIFVLSVVAPFDLV